MGGAQVQPLTATTRKHFGPESGGGGGGKPPRAVSHCGVQAIFTPTHPLQAPPSFVNPNATFLIIS